MAGFYFFPTLHSYEFPRASVATDVVALRFHEPPEKQKRLEVLLIERAKDPHGWALPGGFLLVGDETIEAAAAKGIPNPDIDWTLEDCARRTLKAKVGGSSLRLSQFKAYGRADRDPRGRCVSVAYWTFVHEDRYTPDAGDSGETLAWRAVSDLPKLAFPDHNTIVEDALADIYRQLGELDLFLELMPDEFTYPEFLEAYQAFWIGPLERDPEFLRSNLHRKFKARLTPRGKAEVDVEAKTRDEPREKSGGRPAKRYNLDKVKEAFAKTSR